MRDHHINFYNARGKPLMDSAKICFYIFAAFKKADFCCSVMLLLLAKNIFASKEHLFYRSPPDECFCFIMEPNRYHLMNLKNCRHVSESTSQHVFTIFLVCNISFL